MTNDEKQRLARQFLAILGKPDETIVRSVAIDDVIWTFPGASAISGEARGVTAVMKRAAVIAAHDVRVEIVRTVFGYQAVAVILHNRSAYKGRLLDEHLAAVFTFRDDKISRLDTFLSNIEMAEAFFS